MQSRLLIIFGLILAVLTISYLVFDSSDGSSAPTADGNKDVDIELASSQGDESRTNGPIRTSSLDLESPSIIQSNEVLDSRVINESLNRALGVEELYTLISDSGIQPSVESVSMLRNYYHLICAPTRVYAAEHLNSLPKATRAQAIEDYQSILSSPNRKWAYDALKKLCVDDAAISMDVLQLSVDYPHNELGVLSSILSDIEFGNFERATKTVLDQLKENKSIESILGMTMLLHDINHEAIQANVEYDRLVDHAGLSAFEARNVANKAATLHYCEINGGCGIKNPITLSYCVRLGCEPYMSSLEDVLEWSLSSREMDVLNQYLLLLRLART